MNLPRYTPQHQTTQQPPRGWHVPESISIACHLLCRQQLFGEQDCTSPMVSTAE